VEEGITLVVYDDPSSLKDFRSSYRYATSCVQGRPEGVGSRGDGRGPMPRGAHDVCICRVISICISLIVMNI
jgi:hypothetical protein